MSSAFCYKKGSAHCASFCSHSFAETNMKPLTLSLVAVISFIMCGCDSGTGGAQVLEIKCKVNSGLDQKKKCLEVDRPGAIMEVRVSSTTSAGEERIAVCADRGGRKALENDARW